MTRVKRGVASHAKHKKTLEAVKGYRGSRSRLIRTAKAALLHSGAYAYHGRKRMKRDFRRLWIVRISEAVKSHGHSYSRFIQALKVKNIILDRKILSNIVVDDPKTFEAIVTKAFEGK